MGDWPSPVTAAKNDPNRAHKRLVMHMEATLNEVRTTFLCLHGFLRMRSASLTSACVSALKIEPTAPSSEPVRHDSLATVSAMPDHRVSCACDAGGGRGGGAGGEGGGR